MSEKLSKQPEFVPEMVKLRWPILSDSGAEIKDVTLNLISRKDHAVIVKKNIKEHLIFVEMLALSSGLSALEVGRLVTADWNGLKLKISDMVSKGSDVFFKKMGVDFDPDSPLLLRPIVSGSGKKITKINIQPPTVGSRELMDEFEGSDERALFITMRCTGLAKADFDSISITDWNQLQSRLNDFLNETADFFPSGTSTPSPI